MIKMAGVPLVEAIKMMTKNPATIMGVNDRKGTLAEGLDADITIFDEQINIRATIVNGKLVYGG
jgi:N-acetylglucosamine-6-phosphate deacetylase